MRPDCRALRLALCRNERAGYFQLVPMISASSALALNAAAAAAALRRLDRSLISAGRE